MCRILADGPGHGMGTARRRALSRIPEDTGTAAAGRGRLLNLLPPGARNDETPARLRRSGGRRGGASTISGAGEKLGLVLET